MIRRVRSRKVHAPLALVLALLPCVAGADVQVPPELAAPTRLHDVTVKDQNGALVLRVKTAGPAKYRANFLEAPYRLVVDLEDTVYAWRKGPLVVGREPVQQVRGGQYSRAIARIVVELTRKVGYVVRADDDGLAIIVPMTPVTAGGSARPASATAATPLPPAKAPSLVLTATPTGNEPKAPAPEPPGVEATRTPTAERPQPPTDAAAPAATPARPVTESATRRLQVAQATTPRAPTRPLISLEFKDADIVNLLRTLAAEGGRNIVIGDDVKGKMSISLRNVPLELALQTILEARGLERIDRDGIVRIVTREQFTKEVDSMVKMRDVEAKLAEASQRPEPRGPLREETIRLYYTDAEEVARTLQGILGIGAGVQQVRSTGAPAGPIAEPPFSQLFGPGQQPPAPEAPQLVAPDTLAKGLTIRAHKPTNTLFLRLYQSDLERVKKLIREALDIPLPQVKIEARMEILDRSALEQIGIQWGGATAQPAGAQTIVGSGFTDPRTGGIPVVGLGTLSNPNLVLDQGLPVSSATGLPLGGNLVNLPITALPTASGSPTAGLAFGIIGTRYNINLALQALSSQGKTRTLARPEVVTVENNKATMSLGEEIPYATISSAGTQIQFKEALLKLEVTPTVIREGDVTKIKLNVVVENNSRGDVVNLGTAGSPPAINRRKAETQVIIREGERLIIGGVINATQINTIRKVPIFGDIPLLGWLFKQREESETGRELVVFLTPTVLRTIDRAATAAPMPAAAQK